MKDKKQKYWFKKEKKPNIWSNLDNYKLFKLKKKMTNPKLAEKISVKC